MYHTTQYIDLSKNGMILLYVFSQIWWFIHKKRSFLLHYNVCYMRQARLLSNLLFNMEVDCDRLWAYGGIAAC